MELQLGDRKGVTGKFPVRVIFTPTSPGCEFWRSFYSGAQLRGGVPVRPHEIIFGYFNCPIVGRGGSCIVHVVSWRSIVGLLHELTDTAGSISGRTVRL